MATKRKSYKKRASSTRSKSTVRRRTTRGRGLHGFSSSPKSKGLTTQAATGELLDLALTVGGAVVASKGVNFLAGKLDPDGTNKVKGMIAPLAATAVGVLGAVKGTGAVKSIAKGIAFGGAVKAVGKVMKKDNLLGVDGEDNRPLAMPGIGSFGMAALPELSHYSENPDAPVETTGGDPQYHMGQPSEVLSGNEEFIAY